MTMATATSTGHVSDSIVGDSPALEQFRVFIQGIEWSRKAMKRMMPESSPVVWMPELDRG